MAFFKFRKSGNAPQTGAPAGRNAPRKNAAAAEAETIDALRRRARHRLIGAVVLVVIAVIVFPLVFDTQPRPVAVQAPIIIPDRNQVPPLSVPPPAHDAPPASVSSPARPAASAALPDSAPSNASHGALDLPSASASAPAASRPASSSAGDAARAAEQQAKARAEQQAKARAEQQAKARAEQQAKARAEQQAKAHAEQQAKARAEQQAREAQEREAQHKRTLEAARAQALLKGNEPAAPPASKPSPPAAKRYVIQIGAYAEAASAKAVRQKAAHAGVHTIEQEIDTAGGKRTRVRAGPFASREAAEQAAAKLKRAGLGGSILSL